MRSADRGCRVAWCMAVAFFGVFLTIPLRKQIILKEKMVFPSGTATAQVISVLHSKSIAGEGNTIRRRTAGEEEYQPIPDAEEDSKQASIGASEWKYLGSSFSVSAAATVSEFSFYCRWLIDLL